MKTNIIFSKTRVLLYFLLATLIGSSCTDGFEDMNTPIYPPSNFAEGESFGEGIFLGDSVTVEEMASLKAQISNIGTVFKNFLYEGIYNDYQITTNLTHDIYAGYFANMNPSWLNDSPTYMYHAGWSDMRWNHFYLHRSVEYGMLARAFWFVDHDFEEGTGRYLNAFYITRIYFAFLISLQTDSYGDMPLTDKQLQGVADADAPDFRSQEDVYNIIFALLDDALTNMNPDATNTYDLSKEDRIYGGDVNKWIRFANTLRLRLALRISNAAPETAKKQGELAMAHSGGLMKDDGDNMRTVPKFAPVAQGGENSGGDENIFALCSYKWYDAGMNKDLETAYKELSASGLDPRCPISWYRPLEEGSTESNPIESDREFLGSRSGDSHIQKPSYIHSLLRSYSTDGKVLRDDAWFGYGRESIWLSYSESRFLLAEAAVRGWDGAFDSPYNYFSAGISASMRYYNIPYFQEMVYISGLKLPNPNPFTTNDKEGMLEQIITQKWLAVFPNGNEGWAEFRRTDYPSFISLPLINSSGGGVPNGKFIKRIAYPTDAIDDNPKSPGLVTTGTRMWWDVADTYDNSGNRPHPNNFR